MSGVTPIPPGYHSITPFLMLNDIAGFLDFLRDAFEAQEIHRMPAPDGSVNHAQVRIGDSHILMGDPMGQHPQMPACIYFYVPNADAVYAQALKVGATSIAPPTDQFYGDRNAGVQDKWGNVWWFATHIEDVSESELQKRNKAAWAQHT
jgi:PhnB protein